mmetsp:Transcript_65005/g.194385  ORF Transcript_65005/g.194385 Transcript_65005/m.194385 type:complete len:263 (-) Transcript_65005:63-851(-)
MQRVAVRGRRRRRAIARVEKDQPQVRAARERVWHQVVVPERDVRRVAQVVDGGPGQDVLDVGVAAPLLRLLDRVVEPQARRPRDGGHEGGARAVARGRALETIDLPQRRSQRRRRAVRLLQRRAEQIRPLARQLVKLQQRQVARAHPRCRRHAQLDEVPGQRAPRLVARVDALRHPLRVGAVQRQRMAAGAPVAMEQHQRRLDALLRRRNPHRQRDVRRATAVPDVRAAQLLAEDKRDGVNALLHADGCPPVERRRRHERSE